MSDFEGQSRYIHGEDRFFYFLAFIDVFNKKIVSYHVGKYCTGLDLQLTLKAALGSVRKEDRQRLIIRSDNGSQMSSNQFKAYVDSEDLVHQFTPVRCPDKNAYIESFFSIFEVQFLQVRYFKSLKDVHRQVGDWLLFYNQKRPHGSLKYLSPDRFTQKLKKGLDYQYLVPA